MGRQVAAPHIPAIINSHEGDVRVPCEDKDDHIDWLEQRVSTLERELAVARDLYGARANEVERLRKRLRELEFACSGWEGQRYCPACGQGEHSPNSDCWLAAETKNLP